MGASDWADGVGWLKGVEEDRRKVRVPFVPFPSRRNLEERVSRWLGSPDKA